MWRIEWQIRKETLKRFGLRTFEDLYDGYGSRWPVHPLWSMLNDHINTLPAQGVYRETNEQAALDETLMRMAISMEGYLKKIAAIECIKEGRAMLSQGQAINRLIPLLEMVHNDLTWHGDVQRRIDQLRLAS